MRCSYCSGLAVFAPKLIEQRLLTSNRTRFLPLHYARFACPTLNDNSFALVLGPNVFLFFLSLNFIVILLLMTCAWRVRSPILLRSPSALLMQYAHNISIMYLRAAHCITISARQECHSHTAAAPIALLLLQYLLHRQGAKAREATGVAAAARPLSLQVDPCAQHTPSTSPLQRVVHAVSSGKWK